MMLLRHLLSILVLPTTMAVVVPWLIVSGRPIRLGGSPPRIIALIAGIALLGAGLFLVGSTIRHFATLGRGTLAPWDPPRRLVVAGPYRHVRNPMISGVLLVLLGEALVFYSTDLLAWAGVFFAVNATYIPLIEEPGLERRFGDDYRVYKRHVPRWVPQLVPWEGSGSR